MVACTSIDTNFDKPGGFETDRVERETNRACKTVEGDLDGSELRLPTSMPRSNDSRTLPLDHVDGAIMVKETFGIAIVFHLQIGVSIGRHNHKLWKR